MYSPFLLQQLKCLKNDALDIQLKVFCEHTEEDMIEFSHRLEDIRLDFEYPLKEDREPKNFRPGIGSKHPIGDAFLFSILNGSKRC